MTKNQVEVLKWIIQSKLKKGTQNVFTNYIYWIFMYEADLALNNMYDKP